MNIKTVTSIIILISLVVISYIFLGIGKEVKINNPIENKVVDSKAINNTEEITTKANQLPKHIQPLEQVSAEIVSFNEQLAKDLSIDYDDESARRNAVTFLLSKQRQDSTDVVEEINKYFENIVDNQIEVSELILKCKRSAESLSKLEKKISQTNQELTEDTFTYRGKTIPKANIGLTEDTFNQYYFHQGLLASKICNDVGTKRDPFFAFLESARKGNMLSQLLLTDHLYSAIIRKLINTWKRPLEYMNLRDEAISYLKVLAAKGVTRASVRLAHMYSLSSIFMPRNRILEYYYTVLAKKQEGIEVVYVEDPNKLYDFLTDKQKIIVDRMTENL